jgi:superfamily II DNA or RNA helicase
VRPPLRAWQRAALADYADRSPHDYLTVATPGAGKTTFALSLAADLLARRVVERVTVVTPTDHLKTQWMHAAGQFGLSLDPGYSGKRGKTSADYVGVIATYAGVASTPLAHRLRCERFKTLVILDEIHHAGDALSWGEAVQEAFDPAIRRLALTGTPFRSDTAPIPFVTYAPGADGVLRSMADHSYGYAEALRDGVVRPVLFMAYSGDLRWRTQMGAEVAARLGEPMTRDLAAQALRTALDAAGEWMPAVLAAADARLTEVRRHVPDAGGLVIATDQESARAYAKLLRQVSGQAPTVVVSDEATSSRKISEFASSESRWMVAVRMVSEGVDIPRLAVGVYATSTATPLFFAQAVGRFVRARRRGESASVFLPSVAPLLVLASELEVQRDHALSRSPDEIDPDDPFAESEALMAAAERLETGSDAGDDLLSYKALESQADFDRLVFDGDEFGGAHGDHEEFLGIPGLLDSDQMRALLRRKQAESATSQRRSLRRAPASEDDATRLPSTPTTHAQLATLRRELNGLVAAWHHRTGQPHGSVHSTLARECGGPPAAAASADQLTNRIDTIRQWASRRPH